MLIKKVIDRIELFFGVSIGVMITMLIIALLSFLGTRAYYDHRLAVVNTARYNGYQDCIALVNEMAGAEWYSPRNENISSFYGLSQQSADNDCWSNPTISSNYTNFKGGN
jgi:hypothetical protein